MDSFPACRQQTIGLFCATFYHFFVHDLTGPVGSWLRRSIPDAIRFGLTDDVFAAVVVSFFMQLTGFLQMTRFYGPDFSPFSIVYERFIALTQSTSMPTNGSSQAKQDRLNDNRKLAKQKSKNKLKET